MKRNLKILFILNLLSGNAFSAEGDRPNAFAQSYLNLEYAQNYPASYGQVFFEGSIPYPLIGYRYLLSDEWIMGVHGQFRMLKNRETGGKTFPIFTFVHESLHIFRVHHPIYLDAGFKFMFLMPTKEATIPLDRDADYEAEIGVAVSGGLIWMLESKGFLTARVDRWRGTKTQRLQGFEMSIGYSHPLKN